MGDIENICPGGVQIHSIIVAGVVIILMWLVLGMFFGVVRLDFFLGDPKGWIFPTAVVIMLFVVTGNLMRRIAELNMRRMHVQATRRALLTSSDCRKSEIL